jgi:hypothetical protein
MTGGPDVAEGWFPSVMLTAKKKVGIKRRKIGEIYASSW